MGMPRMMLQEGAPPVPGCAQGKHRRGACQLEIMHSLDPLTLTANQSLTKVHELHAGVLALQVADAHLVASGKGCLRQADEHGAGSQAAIAGPTKQGSRLCNQNDSSDRHRDADPHHPAEQRA